MDPLRRKRLQGLLAKTIKGETHVTVTSARTFLEAVYSQDDPTICIQRLVSSPCGLKSLKIALGCENSIAFLNGPFTALLHYLQSPEIKTLYAGSLLLQVIDTIMQASILWQAYQTAAIAGSLTDNALEAFSWILMLLVSSAKHGSPHLELAGGIELQRRLLSHQNVEVRNRAHRIMHILKMVQGGRRAVEDGPGGRHDNDFELIHSISILPTCDELCSKDAYLPRATDMEDIPPERDVLQTQLDRQFRLLREDMIHDLREEISDVSKETKTGKRKTLKVTHLVLASITCDEKRSWSLQFQCLDGLPHMNNLKPKQRKAFIQENKNYLKNESVGCLVEAGETFLSLVTIIREESLLQEQPAMLCLSVPSSHVERVLLKAKTSQFPFSFIQLNTPIFSYEPILQQLQEIKDLSLVDELFSSTSTHTVPGIEYTTKPGFTTLLRQLESDSSTTLHAPLKISKQIRLDSSQARCFLEGVQQKVSLIQGPPGTGKSFIGSLIAKAIREFSTEKILVVCYTHHALDQFLEELLDLGIAASDIVRLGNSKKATFRTRLLSLWDSNSRHRFTSYQVGLLNRARETIKDAALSLRSAFARFQQTNISKSDIVEHLEFRCGGLPFFEAFEVPFEREDGMTQVGVGGRSIDKFYLFDRWRRGKDAGLFQKSIGHRFSNVWNMRGDQRVAAFEQWRREMAATISSNVYECGEAYDQALQQLRAVYMEKDLEVMREKRIIACTTTAAAKYVKQVQSVAPGVVLVEEAGEILESHILTALSPDTKQLILIGDHKQLRPKVNNYNLSVEKGDGYDLNRSLFERLVLNGFPHQVLAQQHRMRPELSMMIRLLTYPELSDAPNTHGRPNLRGFTDNIVFFDHRQPEADISAAREWREGFSSTSKKNIFESEMTLKCVRYLGQQGYGTEDIVILTPYLGQLRLLVDHLSKTTDPVLSDLDSSDLVRAGLVPDVPITSTGKSKIRISTIDNFQGDESDIVLVSLARSNPRNDIGFLSSPERVNVMLSRARNALILIGNSETFTGSAKGGELWKRVMAVLRTNKHVYDGFPTRCEQHPERTASIKTPSDFDTLCPDGGCQEPCTSILNCGVHLCPQRCHQLFNHGNVRCDRIVETRCKVNHPMSRRCFQSKIVECSQCKTDNDLKQTKLKHSLDVQARRDREAALHASKLQELDQEVQRIKDELEDRKCAEDRARALKQRKHDLEAMKQALATRDSQRRGLGDQAPESVTETVPSQMAEASANAGASPSKSSVYGSDAVDGGQAATDSSPAEREWERQKQVENARNDAIDNIMRLTGLEEVKLKILNIKAKTDTVQRQGTNMKKERLGVVMLGNPGTGKTTVARQYARFLTSVGALSGSGFEEATGSSLANEGVDCTRKKLDNLLKSGGGVFFIDEAYQLTSGNSHGGGAVLDFLLAEIEERIGEVAFVFAGYTKEMEKFFEHNPGLESRLPHRLTFADYTNDELLAMLGRYVNEKYSGRAKLQEGLHGIYTRILIERLGRRRSLPGFGNARSLQNAWSKVAERQAQRTAAERKKGHLPDDLVFTKEDVIGPRPEDMIQSSRAWKELKGMVGLKSVKDNISTLVRCVEQNYHRELKRKPIIEVPLNRLFLGSPGTGKTTVGKLYAIILSELGLLSKNEVVIKSPADFVGAVLGESEKNTRAILKATEGKVLMIDEAYGLSPKGGVGAGSADPYKAAIIDTIVGEVQSTPGEDRCVLLLGYEDQMREMLDGSNPGLARRFPISDAFHFEDFNDEELRSILDYKLNKQGLEATDEAKEVAIGILSRARDRPNFGNAGEVENVISKAKTSYQSRALANPGGLEGDSADVVFLPQDFDPDFDRAARSNSVCARLFSNMVGGEEWIKTFEKCQKMTLNLKARKKDPREHVPFNFVFKGPPGTGKTTVARKVAELYYELGILSTKEYIECSASDLVAQYVGQTGPKTRDMLTKALGKVLFIDEAYRLCDGPFGKEAVDELVDSITKPQFKGKVVVILAGYTNDIDRLLQINRGLASRFPTEINFRNMAPEACLKLLEMELQKSTIMLSPHCSDSGHSTHAQLLGVFEQLAQLPSWGNGRDVVTISKDLVSTIFEQADESTTPLVATGDDVLRVLEGTLSTQRARTCARPPSTDVIQQPTAETEQKTLIPPQSANSIATAISETAPEAAIEDKPEETSSELVDPTNDLDEQRDVEVSNDIWNQLQADKQAQEAAARSYDQTLQKHTQALAELGEASNESASELAKLEKLQHDADAEAANELKRKREQERIRLLIIQRSKQEREEKLKRIREAEEARRKEEAQAQKKLRYMGVCPVGFRWIKQQGGYRCAGGSHFVTDAELRS